MSSKVLTTAQAIKPGFGTWCAPSYEAAAGTHPFSESTWRLYDYPGGAASCLATTTPLPKQGVRPGYPNIPNHFCCMMALLHTPACTLVCSTRHQLVMGVPVPPGPHTPAYATQVSMPTPPGSTWLHVSCLPQGQCQGIHPCMLENAMPGTYLKADAQNAGKFHLCIQLLLNPYDQACAGNMGQTGSCPGKKDQYGYHCGDSATNMWEAAMPTKSRMRSEAYSAHNLQVATL